MRMLLHRRVRSVQAGITQIDKIEDATALHRTVAHIHETHLLTCHLCRIQTWALEEARRRLEKEGILEDPNPE
jgi:hypothetical protein